VRPDAGAGPAAAQSIERLGRARLHPRHRGARDPGRVRRRRPPSGAPRRRRARGGAASRGMAGPATRSAWCARFLLGDAHGRRRGSRAPHRAHTLSEPLSSSPPSPRSPLPMIRVFSMAVLAFLAKASHQSSPDHLPALTPALVAPAVSTPITSPDRGSSPGDWLDRTPQFGSTQHVPPAAENCTAIVDTVANRLVQFGGKGDDNRDLNELWTMDLDKFVWTKVETPAPAPPEREDHVAI